MFNDALGIINHDHDYVLMDLVHNDNGMYSTVWGIQNSIRNYYFF